MELKEKTCVSSGNLTEPLLGYIAGLLLKQLSNRMANY